MVWLTDGAGIMVGPGADARVFAAGPAAAVPERKMLSGTDAPATSGQLIPRPAPLRRGEMIKVEGSHLRAVWPAVTRHSAQIYAGLKP